MAFSYISGTGLLPWPGFPISYLGSILKCIMHLEVVKGDITLIETDAIVNAANPTLMGGGGVDGAIHKAGGRQILEECRAIVKIQGQCRVGEAVITSGGELKAKKVIHTVGPTWKGGTQGEASLLSRCYRNSLQLAEENGLKSVAFPNISTGVYGYPKEEAARVALEAVLGHIPVSLSKVVFVCFDNENHRIYVDKINNTGRVSSRIEEPGTPI